MTVNLKRDDIAQSGSANTGAEAKWTATNGGPKPGVETDVSIANLKKYLSGGILLNYSDDLNSYPIPEDSKISFLYNAEVTIKVTTTTGKTITITCSYGDPTQIDFYRKSKIDPNINGQYTSRPSYWSEIKEGSPNNESFEAMAGTPTTHNLYFASGGSEYIVDIVTEYVKNASATRTYTSKFNAVKSGLWIDGDSTSQNDSPPPCEARTSTDISGATFTETATISEGTYVKEPAKGTPGEPGYEPEVTGPSYTCTRSGGHNIMVGGYSKSWTQIVTFDYTKIKKVAVWKLVRSKVNGLTTLIGTDEVTASIKQGDPTFFYNIASSDDSAGGRLRYSLETAQGDHVVWNEGDSDNKDSNSSSDDYVNEDKKFAERAKLANTANAISDFLILQTSSGDQSVMYFEKSAPEVTVDTTKIDIPKTSKAEQWDNNSLSAANWSPDAINIGSYNGKFGAPATKYSGSGNHGTVPTKLDQYPAAMSRPARPSQPMILDKEGLDVFDTLPNGQYVMGTSSVFYQLELSYGTGSRPYATTYNSNYGANGVQFGSTYSNNHSKVNDVVIHNPVSSQYAMIMPLPADRDQRTTASKALGGNLTQATVEYQKSLNPNYKQNLVVNGDAEILDSNTQVSGWTGYTTTPDKVSFTSRTGDGWVMAGTNSFEIRTDSNPGGTGTSYTGTYYRDVTIKPDTKYKFTGSLSCHRCTGSITLDAYDSLLQTYSAGTVSNTGTVTPLSLEFTSL